MEQLSEAISITVVGIGVVIAVLLVLMLILFLISRLLTDKDPTEKIRVEEPAKKQTVETSAENKKMVYVIISALEAYGIKIPTGGRLKIEKVTRQN